MANYPAKKQNGSVPDVVNQKLQAIAKNEGVPPEGLTVLGGKIYVNVTGLDVKVKTKCKEENLILKGVSVIPIECEREDLFGYEGKIVFFDKDGFQKALSACGDISPEVLDRLTEAFTSTFSDVGWASPDTCEGIAYEYKWSDPAKKKVKGKMLVENVIMMASRRATNRAKREATGTGLTSVDELPGFNSMSNGTTKPATKPPQKKSTSPKSEDGSDDEIKDKLSQILFDLAGGEVDQIPGLIEQYSSFEGKDGNVVSRDSLDALNGKWLNSTYGKAKADWEQAGYGQDTAGELSE